MAGQGHLLMRADLVTLTELRDSHIGGRRECPRRAGLLSQILLLFLLAAEVPTSIQLQPPSAAVADTGKVLVLVLILVYFEVYWYW